jgi:hypothetical protein
MNGWFEVINVFLDFGAIQVATVGPPVRRWIFGFDVAQNGLGAPPSLVAAIEPKHVAFVHFRMDWGLRFVRPLIRIELLAAIALGFVVLLVRTGSS